MKFCELTQLINITILITLLRVEPMVNIGSDGLKSVVTIFKLKNII